MVQAEKPVTLYAVGDNFQVTFLYVPHLRHLPQQQSPPYLELLLEHQGGVVGELVLHLIGLERLDLRRISLYLRGGGTTNEAFSKKKKKYDCLPSLPQLWVIKTLSKPKYDRRRDGASFKARM